MHGNYVMDGFRVVSKLRTITVAVISMAVSAGADSLLPSTLGIPNFHQVNPGVLRGGQPTTEGFLSLAKLGIKTVLDLRASSEQSNWEAKKVTSLGMQYVHLPLRGQVTPSHIDLDKAFSVLEDSSQQPVFVHCREGKDRTGMIIGCYRISHDGWTGTCATAEAKSLAMRELTSAMEHYILRFQPEGHATPKQELRQDHHGGTLGGPIIARDLV